MLVGPLIKQQISALFAALPTIIGQIEQVWLPSVARFLDLDGGENVGLGAFLAQYKDMAGSWAGTIFTSVTSTGSMLAAAGNEPVSRANPDVYLLRDWDSLVAHFGALVPDSQRATVFELARETDAILGAFLRGQLLVMFALAVIYSLGLSLIGLKFAIAIGVVAGLVSFVPYLGFVFGIGIASLTVALEPNPVWQLVGVFATFTIAQLIEARC